MVGGQLVTDNEDGINANGFEVATVVTSIGDSIGQEKITLTPSILPDSASGHYNGERVYISSQFIAFSNPLTGTFRLLRADGTAVTGVTFSYISETSVLMTLSTQTKGSEGPFTVTYVNGSVSVTQSSRSSRRISLWSQTENTTLSRVTPPPRPNRAGWRARSASPLPTSSGTRLKNATWRSEATGFPQARERDALATYDIAQSALYNMNNCETRCHAGERGGIGGRSLLAGSCQEKRYSGLWDLPSSMTGATTEPTASSFQARRGPELFQPGGRYGADRKRHGHARGDGLSRRADQLLLRLCQVL